MAIEQAKASTEQAKVLQEYLKLFRVDSPPEGHVIRDVDEWKAELQREMTEAGVPEGSQQLQLQYILQGMEEGD